MLVQKTHSYSHYPSQSRTSSPELWFKLPHGVWQYFLYELAIEELIRSCYVFVLASCSKFSHNQCHRVFMYLDSTPVGLQLSQLISDIETDSHGHYFSSHLCLHSLLPFSFLVSTSGISLVRKAWHGLHAPMFQPDFVVIDKYYILSSNNLIISWDW